MTTPARPNWWPSRWNVHDPEKYVDKLKALTPDQMRKEAELYIWLSAYANNNPRSDYHWMVDAIYDEYARREDTDGYSKAHAAVVAGTRG